MEWLLDVDLFGAGFEIIRSVLDLVSELILLLNCENSYEEKGSRLEVMHLKYLLKTLVSWTNIYQR